MLMGISKWKLLLVFFQVHFSLTFPSEKVHENGNCLEASVSCGVTPSAIIMVTLYNREHLFTINYDFSLNKLLICCLLIVSKVVVKFRYWVWLGM